MGCLREELKKKREEWDKKFDEHNKYVVSSIENRGYEYEGERLDGKLHGQGILKLSDGTFYKGTFLNGEIWDVSWYDKDGNRSIYDEGLRYDENYPSEEILNFLYEK